MAEAQKFHWTGHRLNRIKCSNIPADIRERRSFGSTKPLLPHKLIKIWWNFCCMATLHVFYLPLYPSPITLHILCMHTSCWINEVATVVYSAMSCNSGQGGYSSIWVPLIRMDGCSWSSMGLNDGEERSSVNNFHVSQSLSVWSVHQTEHPHFLWGCASPVVLWWMLRYWWYVM